MFKVVTSLNDGIRDTVQSFITLNDMPIMELPEVSKPDNIKDYDLLWKNGVFNYMLEKGKKEIAKHGYNNPIISIEGSYKLMQEYHKLMVANH